MPSHTKPKFALDLKSNTNHAVGLGKVKTYGQVDKTVAQERNDNGAVNQQHNNSVL